MTPSRERDIIEAQIPRDVCSIELPLPRIARGKVREMFAVREAILIVATDRLSAFDIVFERGIPDKGRVLTGLSDFWMNRLAAAPPHHRIATNIDAIIEHAPVLAEYRSLLNGRAMLCRRAEPIDVECVVRGYLDGSGWKEYAETGSVAGHSLPTGLERGAELPEPLFTPAIKARTGHDENITWSRLVDLIGRDFAEALRDRSFALYDEGCDHARRRGLILADTKFEFGWVGDPPELYLIDEILTPDSSRFWAIDTWQPGAPQISFDKQPVRDFLAAEKASGRWNGEPPLPPLSAETITATVTRYRAAYHRLTGHELPEVE